MDITRLGKN